MDLLRVLRTFVASESGSHVIAGSHPFNDALIDLIIRHLDNIELQNELLDITIAAFDKKAIGYAYELVKGKFIKKVSAHYLQLLKLDKVELSTKTLTVLSSIIVQFITSPKDGIPADFLEQTFQIIIKQFKTFESDFEFRKKSSTFLFSDL